MHAPRDDEGYSSLELRRSLSRFAVRLSRRRRVAVFSPLFAAVFFWYTVPAFAATLAGNPSSPSPITVVSPPPGSSQTVTTGAPHALSSGTSVQQAAPPQGAAPAQAPPAAVQSGGAMAGAPVTGAADEGFLRAALIGACLLASGFALLTAPKRNPHAEAIAA